ncbi:unnamed protein product [Thlaspi arvense]|uniref:beta-galactosidase n=1 Tax=Thlaspi arvense TaxID=13288 RepID=A0AAU9RWW2_THLAR|nr:unnamed protein product [Thlaspi arvense]
MREFYTGWLTHWGENIVKTNAASTAAALEKILSRNGSAVLYMAHGGTNFGFYSGSNTGANESDYKPDLTSYDYDAPIQESGDVNNAKFKALRRVINKYSSASLPSIPRNPNRTAYGHIQLKKTVYLLDTLNIKNTIDVAESESPISMESAGQYAGNNEGSILSIPKVHDRAQVFISCPSRNDDERPTYIGTIERWSNRPLHLPYINCPSYNKLFVLYGADRLIRGHLNKFHELGHSNEECEGGGSNEKQGSNGEGSLNAGCDWNKDHSNEGHLNKKHSSEGSKVGPSEG